MKLEFKRKNMDIGTPEFCWMRAVMPIPTGGADLSECIQVADRIRKDDDKSWVTEWKALAEGVRDRSAAWLDDGQLVNGRNALLRAANYFRTALIRCSTFDPLADRLLTCSRDCFEAAARLFDPPIEIVRIPFGEHILPGYFISAGKPFAPTLIGVNGGDSTNEEMFHTLGFAAARERGWNLLVYEGPGQFTARQLNPGLNLRSDWEVPNGAVIDWLLKRPDVDPAKIALFGWSLSSNLVIRAAAFDRRIAAVISNGLIVDVYDAWFGIWPKWLQRAKPKNFDRVFHLLERLSSQVRALTSIFYQLHGVDTPSAVIQAWKPFNVSDLADKLNCPALFITGEAEYAEQSAGPLILSIGRFLRGLKAPAWIHEFGFESGWAASHCQIGAQSAHQEIVYDWLDMVLVNKERFAKRIEKKHDFSKVENYFGKMPEFKKLLAETHINSF